MNKPTYYATPGENTADEDDALRFDQIARTAAHASRGECTITFALHVIAALMSSIGQTHTPPDGTEGL